MDKAATLYQDIAKRTDGDIYIGVVGPVRTGKSTFIKRFMETMVIPKIENQPRRERAVDELPQSGSGKTIMTTEPKFIPEEAVKIAVDGNASFNVRMIDCVGYIVPSALGYIENQQPRMVMTPWFDREIPFNMAAEIGTKKVITEHSTIGLVVTTDGSISDIARGEYEEAEARVIDELKTINKPFVILLNCVAPKSPKSRELRDTLEERYSVPVLPVNCMELEENDIAEILSKILYEFPVKEVALGIPGWIMNLEKGHWLREAVYSQVRAIAPELHHLTGVEKTIGGLCDCEYIDGASVSDIN
ncbi:MAG: stage IV sporulation protein A, partial [Angelakisella sp.]